MLHLRLLSGHPVLVACIVIKLHCHMTQRGTVMTSIPLAKVWNGDCIDFVIIFLLILVLQIVLAFVVEWTIIALVSLSDNTLSWLSLLEKWLIVRARSRLLSFFQRSYSLDYIELCAIFSIRSLFFANHICVYGWLARRWLRRHNILLLDYMLRLCVVMHSWTPSDTFVAFDRALGPYMSLLYPWS